jgi:methyltransferase (TIGR00027 family)
MTSPGRDVASRTAQYMALFRAIESARPPASRLFEDPLASAFLRPGLRSVALAARIPPARAFVTRFIDRRWPGPRASAVVRTRLIDDALGEALAGGASQVVLLGAGFDTRAVRIAGIERTRVFELDRPATLAVKRRGLTRALGSLPAHMALVPIDFNRQALGDVLVAGGFDPAAQAFFVWEGVTNYLDEDAVDATFRDLVGLARPGSAVTFTYIHRAVLEDPDRFPGAAATLAAVRNAGEPFRFGFEPAQLPGYLAERGLSLDRDVATADAAEDYLRPLGREETVFGFYRVALARIAPTA